MTEARAPTPPDAVSPKDIATNQRLKQLVNLQDHIRAAIIIPKGLLGIISWHDVIYASHESLRVADRVFEGNVPKRAPDTKYDIYTQDAVFDGQKIVDHRSRSILPNAARPVIRHCYFFGNEVLNGAESARVDNSLIVALQSAFSENGRDGQLRDVTIKNSVIIAPKALNGVKGVVEDSFIVALDLNSMFKGSDVKLRNTYLIALNEVTNGKPQVFCFGGGGPVIV